MPNNESQHDPFNSVPKDLSQHDSSSGVYA